MRNCKSSNLRLFLCPFFGLLYCFVRYVFKYVPFSNYNEEGMPRFLLQHPFSRHMNLSSSFVQRPVIRDSSQIILHIAVQHQIGIPDRIIVEQVVQL